MPPNRPAPPAHRTLADAATAQLHEAILASDLAAGSPLRLTDLADSLGMSMMPIREAIRRLESLGLVEVVPHKGAWVREFTLDDAHDTHEMRLLLEVTAVERAAQRFTDRDAEKARAALDRHTNAEQAGDHATARRAHTDFHFAIYAAAGSRWLLHALEPVWQNGERYRFAGTRGAEARAERLAEHQHILAACVARDVVAAAEAVRAHIHHSRSSIVARLTRTDAP